ncbi:MAG: hypothetical protein K2M89_03880 [Clostridiales bacterium]|nr:hypothetical protein [Clostridiales bacterium]
MDKKTVQTIMSVVLGIAAFVIVAALVSLFFGAILAEDPVEISETAESVEKVLLYVKNSSIAVICIGIPTVVCYFFTFFSKSKKAFGLISAILSLVLVEMCLGFIFDLRSIVLKLTDDVSTCYSLATAFFTDLIEVLVSCLISCAYFIVVTVCAFRTKNPAAQPVPTVEQTTVAPPAQGE